MSVTTSEITTQLFGMIKLIKRIANRTKKKNKPNKKALRGKRLRKFYYMKPMLTSAGSTEYDREIDDWSYLQWHIQHYLKNLPEYKHLLKSIKKHSANFKEEYLQNFTIKVIRLCLYNQLQGFHSPRNLVNAFLKEMADKPLLHKLDFELSGIALTPTIIKISPTIYLKKITKRDVEEPVPLEDYIAYRRREHNSLTKLHVEYYEKNDYIDFHKWELIISILRLYKVCNVEFNSVTEISESTKNWYMYGGKHLYSNHFYIFASLLTKRDEPRLRQFWKIIEKRLPDSFKVTFTQTDYKAIAYERYMQAMTHGGPEEMRVAYAISALEALYTTEKDELKYRLRMRLARVLGILGLDTRTVYSDIGEAYDIRSIFDHGDKLKTKDILKLRQKYQYERKLTLILLDYVRISIIVTIMIDKNKSDFKELIDNSWISSKAFSDLKSILKEPAKLLDLESYNPVYSVAPFNKVDFSYVK